MPGTLFEVVIHGSAPELITWGFINQNASITTLPFTLWIGSTTTATARWCSHSNAPYVDTSTILSQHPNPGCEWYHPTTLSVIPTSFNISSIFAWYSGSTVSTETAVPTYGIANTSQTSIVNGSKKLPSIRPITSNGTPAQQCFSILSIARGCMLISSDVS